MEIIGLLRAPRQLRPTDVVLPMEGDEDASPADDIEQLDWCFDDPQLTMQLRAVHRGRGWILASIAGSIAAIATGIALVI